MPKVYHAEHRGQRTAAKTMMLATQRDRSTASDAGCSPGRLVLRHRVTVDYCYLFGESWRVIHARSSGYMDEHIRVKIGCTGDPRQRMHHLRVMLPEWDYHNVWWAAGQGMDIESRLHKYYATARIAGEIFELPEWELRWLADLSSDRILGSRMLCREPDWEWLQETDWRAKWKAVGTFSHTEPDVVLWEQAQMPQNAQAEPRPNNTLQ